MKTLKELYEAINNTVSGDDAAVAYFIRLHDKSATSADKVRGNTLFKQAGFKSSKMKQSDHDITNTFNEKYVWGGMDRNEYRQTTARSGYMPQATKFLNQGGKPAYFIGGTYNPSDKISKYILWDSNGKVLKEFTAK